jgi:putative PIN family toxin of toxin-antitoxin system
VRAVLDTNVVVSALLWGGIPERLIEFAGEGALELFTSEALLAELAGVLTRSKFAARLRQKNLSPADIVANYQSLAGIVEATSVGEVILPDPDDMAVIACALAARADLIVSGDEDLRALKIYRHIRIVSAAEALSIVSVA